MISTDQPEAVDALRRQLDEALRRAESLRHVIESISGELALEPLLTRIVESAVTLIGARLGSIGLVVEQAGGPVVRTAAIYNMPAHELGAEMPFSKKDAEDGIVIASNDEYAGTLADLDGNLGDSDAFRSVIDDAASQQAVAFFNWDSIEPAIIESMESSGASASVIENVRALQAFGWSAGVDGDYATSSFQMSVD